MIIYDLETIRPVAPKNPADRIPGIEYAEGWHDLAGMGIACAVIYCYASNRYFRYQIEPVQGHGDWYLVRKKIVWHAQYDNHSIVVGFNSNAFDDQLLNKAESDPVLYRPSWDLLQHIWAGAGLGPNYNKETHSGFSLDAVARANGLTGKTGTGEQAPVLWQRGQHLQVLEHCEQDVRILKGLIDIVLAFGELADPRDPSQKLKIAAPALENLRAAHKAALAYRKRH